MNLTDAQREALSRWFESITGAKTATILYAARVLASVRWSLDEIVSQLESAGALQGAARVFVVQALDGKGAEIARVDCKIDPKQGLMLAREDRELATREASATAQAIAASDHRAITATVKAVSDQNAESHSALVAMVSAVGQAGSALMKANAEAMKALSEQNKALSEENAELRADKRRLQENFIEAESIAKSALDEAEKLKQDSKDLVLVIKSAFGGSVMELVKNFAARNPVLGAALTEAPSAEKKPEGN